MAGPAPQLLDPQRTLAVICGASDWPHLEQFEPSEAFAATAARLCRYLASDDAGMGLPNDHLLNLFNDTTSAVDQLARVSKFLTAGFQQMGAEHGNSAAVLFSYIGHGTFVGSNHEYCLLVRATSEPFVEMTSLRVRELAEMLKNVGARSTRVVILDSCFAGAAFTSFQSDIRQVESEKIDEQFSRGVAILCAASKRNPAHLEERYTAFGAALLETLENGDAEVSGPMSLGRVCELVQLRLKEVKDAPRPEAHDPDQAGAKVSERPIFPNPASPNGAGPVLGAEIPSDRDYRDGHRWRRPKTVAIAVGALAVVAIVAIVGYLVLGRISQGPQAHKPQEAGLVPRTALAGLLLSPAEINSIMGATEMVVTQSVTTGFDDSPNSPDKDCLLVVGPAQTSAYAGSPYRDVRAQALVQPRTAPFSYTVDQAVVSFPSPDDARKFFSASFQRWSSCAGRPFTWAKAGQAPLAPLVYDVGQVSNDNGTLSMSKTLEGTRWTCLHALTVRNNVVIDASACSYDQDDPAAVNIAHQIAAMVAKH